MSFSGTRIAHVMESPEPHWENSGTCVAVVETSSPAASYRDGFIRNFSEIRAISARLAQPGVAVVALDAYRGNLAASFVLAAKTGIANSAIIGRHDRSDLWLRRDETLSLRHLAVIVEPLRVGSTEVCFRVVDLRTKAGFCDERGRQLEAVAADGPVFLRCAGYLLFLVRTDDVARWPESGEAAWDELPERIYRVAREADMERARRLLADDRRSAQRARQPSQRADTQGDEPGDPWSRMTSITLTPGPLRSTTDELLAADEEPLGVLEVVSRAGARDLVISARAADRGILLGRYSRCDCDGVLDVGDGISRIHLLIIRVGDRLYAIDTASKNGTSTDERDDVRIQPLSRACSLRLAENLASVTWRPAVTPV